VLLAIAAPIAPDEDDNAISDHDGTPRAGRGPAESPGS
jgi:hypothetical protein